MAVLQIITGQDHPVLRGENRKITSFGRDLQKLISDMVETTKHMKGVGLAAPQIGVSKHLIVTRIGTSFMPMINPEITWKSDKHIDIEEGCLSLPDVWIHVPRPIEVAIRYLNDRGREQERKFTGLESRAVQHEIDHLNGILIVDYRLSGSLQRSSANG